MRKKELRKQFAKDLALCCYIIENVPFEQILSRSHQLFDDYDDMKIRWKIYSNRKGEWKDR